MLDIFPLALFPQGALTSSVITTAWVGIFVVCFFNLRFGWVLSGMIVPGYLVPLLLIKPWSAGVIIFESIITYLIVWLFSEKFSRLGFWSSFFGRDRFFLLVVVSVFVRLMFDVWLLPEFGEWLSQSLSFNFDYRNNLHSFGLIIVSLIANQFWKTGVIRGLWPFFVTLSISYLIVRYGLMELTNFTLSNLNYIYEDISSSILASPKAYIILLAAAFIASRMNLRYGWDYNGILIPALLALQWYQPSKVFISFFEAFIILWLAKLVLMMPAFANFNIEGARKILLFFNLGFIYKVVLGYFILWQYPDMKVTDAYGFGYLLSTLMAIKMYDKDIAIRFTKSTVQTSLIAVLMASFIGFSLTLASSYFSDKMRPLNNSLQKELNYLDTNLSEQARNDKIILYQSRLLDKQLNVLPAEIDQFSRGLKKIKEYLRTREQYLLTLATEDFNALGFELFLINNRYLYLKEQQLIKGWGLYIIDTQAHNKLLVEVPYPLDEQGVFEVGVSFFKQMNAFAFASGGVLKKLNIDNSSDVLANRRTFFHLFHEIMSSDDVIQIRHQHNNENKLVIKQSIPDGVNLKKLKEMLKQIKFVWGESNEVNRQRENMSSGFAELFITSDALRRIISYQFHQPQSIAVETSSQSIDGFLQEWILNSRGMIAEKGSNLYVPPTEEELLFFDEEIITPLIKMIDGYTKISAQTTTQVASHITPHISSHLSTHKSKWTESLQSELNNIMGNAGAFGYQLIHYVHKKTQQEYIILYEKNDSKRKYWGTYVFRLYESEPYIIENPRPVYEVNSFEYAASLFEQLNARALLIAGAHPFANSDGQADMVQSQNQLSLLTLINQVIMREHKNRPLFVFSVRAFGFREDLKLPDSDILISLSHGIRAENKLFEGLNALLTLFDNNKFSYQFVIGEVETMGYEIGSIPQSLYALVSQNKVFGVLWLSPFIRKSYRQKYNDFAETGRFNSLGIETIELDVAQYLEENLAYSNQAEPGLMNDKNRLTKPNVNTLFNSVPKLVPKLVPNAIVPDALVPDAFREHLNNYNHTHDFIVLMKALSSVEEFTYQRLIDKNTHQSFLLVKSSAAGHKQKIVMLINLSPVDYASSIILNNKKTLASDIEQYINSRTAWLLMGQSL